MTTDSRHGEHTPGPWVDWNNGKWLYEPSKLLARLEDARLIASAPELLAALRPLAAHADILEQHFTEEELAAMDQEHHLIAHGISVADSFRARAAVARAEGRA